MQLQFNINLVDYLTEVRSVFSAWSDDQEFHKHMMELYHTKVL